MPGKTKLTVNLDPIHLDLLADLMPFYGNGPAEVARNVIVDWLRTNLGWDTIRKRKGVK